jgi:hypothetical protein
MCVMRNHPYPCTDTWPWDTAAQVDVGLPTMPTPEVRQDLNEDETEPAGRPR